jgi:hypothetical protein
MRPLSEGSSHGSYRINRDAECCCVCHQLVQSALYNICRPHAEQTFPHIADCSLSRSMLLLLLLLLLPTNTRMRRLGL